MKTFTLFDTCFLTQYIKWQRKSRKGKHIKSRDTYFQQDLHSTFIVLSNIQIIKRELTPGKINVLLFIFLKSGAWECTFSPCFMWRISSNDIKQKVYLIDHKRISRHLLDSQTLLIDPSRVLMLILYLFYLLFLRWESSCELSTSGLAEEFQVDNVEHH